MILVAGHACIDLLPTLTTPLPAPGHLVGTGPLTMAGGGVVSNTGTALHRLGIPVRLVARTGDDLLGACLRQIYASHHPSLAEHLVTVPGQPTSYSVVLSPPGEDRRFLHCPGVNATFTTADLTAAHFSGCSHLHFGYPTVMPSLYTDGGVALAGIFAAARRAGLSTSLDLCHPDAPALLADWPELFATVLPHVDLFCPSDDELRVCLGAPNAAPEELLSILLALGTSAVVIKRGHHGLVYRSADTSRWAPPDWARGSASHPCYRVKVAGTTGSGDATIAGLLAGLHLRLPLDQALSLACATGAACCERPDATSGVLPLAELQARLAEDWATLPF